MAEAPQRRGRAIDAVIGIALFGGAVPYLLSLPHNLGHADEAFFLYHARRILEGQVVFRDFHELHMPLPHYALALLYRLFGTGMETAHAAFAVLHGALAVVSFAAARRLGARPELAALVGLSYLALCEPAWPHASPHWFATALMMLLLLALVGRGGPSRRAVLLPGLLLGLLVCAQHQNGAPMALGVAAVLACDAASRRRLGVGGPSTLRRLAVLGATASAVVAAFLLLHVWIAGPGPVFTQLVVEPFTHYRAVNSTWWGSAEAVADQLAPFTSVTLLRYLPLLLLVGGLRAVLAWRRRDAATLERQGLLLPFCAAAALSIWYYPDFIHIAFIAPPFFALTAETLEAFLRRLGPGPAVRATGLVLAAAAAAGLGLHLRDNAARFHAWFPYSVETAFGRVDVQSAEEQRLVEAVYQRLRSEEVEEFLAYPVYISLYLMTGTRNPSPHDYALAGYKSPAQLREIRETLRDRELPYVYLIPELAPRSDPVVRYVQRHYECVLRRAPRGRRSGDCVLYRRL